MRDRHRLKWRYSSASRIAEWDPDFREEQCSSDPWDLTSNLDDISISPANLQHPPMCPRMCHGKRLSHDVGALKMEKDPFHNSGCVPGDCRGHFSVIGLSESRVHNHPSFCLFTVRDKRMRIQGHVANSKIDRTGRIRWSRGRLTTANIVIDRVRTVGTRELGLVAVGRIERPTRGL